MVGEDMLSCDSSAILRIILMVKDIINIIHILVPVLLILMCMLDVFKLVMSSMDKNSNTFKKIGNRVLAAVVVFLVPALMDIVLNTLEVGSITASTCWVNANKQMVKALQEQEDKEAKDKAAADAKAAKEFNAQEQAKQLADRKALDFSKKTTSSSSGGGVLLIAGHAYAGTCEVCGECRGYFRGYAEEVETRDLAIALKNALKKEGINAVIANQVLLGDETDTKMDTSFRCSRMGKGNEANAFAQLESAGYWASFDHVIEIHFNASANHTASGSLLTVSGGKESQITTIDNIILDSVSKYTGGKKSPWGFQVNGANASLGDWEFFVNHKGKPMTYIEVEFYDNDSAMASYRSKMNELAQDVAQTLKANGY